MLEGGGGANDLSGGPDVDRVVYSGAAAQTITLDDVRNEGAAGELDDIHSDIEDVAAGAGNDVVFGDDAANVLDGGDGDDRLQRGGGADTDIGGSGADALALPRPAPQRPGGAPCAEQPLRAPGARCGGARTEPAARADRRRNGVA